MTDTPTPPLTAADVLAKSGFTEYRKTTLTPISDITFPPGTLYQTPEGLRAEDEETRCAFDVQGGIYPIRESVFQASYEPATLDRDRAALQAALAGVGLPENASINDLIRHHRNNEAAAQGGWKIAYDALAARAFDVEARPVVRWFAGEMERQLRENDHKGGWEGCDIYWLLERCEQEFAELVLAVKGGRPAAEVVAEAADVANFALMVADNIGPHALPASPSRAGEDQR